jgi:hypothetical protein
MKAQILLVLLVCNLSLVYCQNQGNNRTVITPGPIASIVSN